MPVDLRPDLRDAEAQLTTLLATSGARERASIERHLTACEAEPDASHARLWRRLAVRLKTLAPMPVQTSGRHVVLFFIADGKYRKQVFALEDRSDGRLLLYLPDVLSEAVSTNLLVRTGEGTYGVAGSVWQPLTVNPMDATISPQAPEHVKHMLGWNRKAVMLTLRTSESDGPEVAAAEALCSLAARQWEAVKA